MLVRHTQMKRQESWVRWGSSVEWTLNSNHVRTYPHAWHVGIQIIKALSQGPLRNMHSKHTTSQGSWPTLHPEYILQTPTRWTDRPKDTKIKKRRKKARLEKLRGDWMLPKPHKVPVVYSWTDPKEGLMHVVDGRASRVHMQCVWVSISELAAAAVWSV